MGKLSNIAQQSADARKNFDYDAQPESSPDNNPGNSKSPETGGNETTSSAKGEAEKYFYKPPAGLEDIQREPGNRAKWSAVLDGAIEKIITSKKTAGKQAQFYNAARERGTQAEQVTIKWRAYPKNFENKGGDRWKLADIRANQDEYCEWEVKRENGELKCVTFTTELPEVCLVVYEFWRTHDLLIPMAMKVLQLLGFHRPKGGAFTQHLQWCTKPGIEQARRIQRLI